MAWADWDTVDSVGGVVEIASDDVADDDVCGELGVEAEEYDGLPGAGLVDYMCGVDCGCTDAASDAYGNIEVSVCPGIKS